MLVFGVNAWLRLDEREQMDRVSWLVLAAEVVAAAVAIWLKRRYAPEDRDERTA